MTICFKKGEHRFGRWFKGSKPCPTFPSSLRSILSFLLWYFPTKNRFINLIYKTKDKWLFPAKHQKITASHRGSTWITLLSLSNIQYGVELQSSEFITICKKWDNSVQNWRNETTFICILLILRCYFFQFKLAEHGMFLTPWGWFSFFYF